MLMSGEVANYSVGWSHHRYSVGTRFSPTPTPRRNFCIENILWHREEWMSILSSVPRIEPGLTTQLGTTPEGQETGEAQEVPLSECTCWRIYCHGPHSGNRRSHSFCVSSCLVNTRLPQAFEYCSSKWPFSLSTSLFLSFYFLATFPTINSQNHGYLSGDVLACSFSPQSSIPQFSPRIQRKHTDCFTIIKSRNRITSNRKAGSPLFQGLISLVLWGILAGQPPRSSAPPQLKVV